MRIDASRELDALGWKWYLGNNRAPEIPEGCQVARIAIQHKTNYVLYSEFGELRGEVSGKFFYMAGGQHELPAVGDWVVINARPGEHAATIIDVLPRRTKFSRHAPGKVGTEQIIATNIDKVFIVAGLDGDFNIRRIERYLVTTHESGALAIVVLNKSDVCDDLEQRIADAKAIAEGTSVIAVSALHGTGLDQLRTALNPGETGALLGSSGVGKSTIANHLLGSDQLRTQEVRERDDKGRHTTTHRELLKLPNGGLLVDTPGLRELQLWGGEEGIQDAFEDIELLAQECRFNDCRHEAEPDCAVRSALESGTLDKTRYASYVKLQREIAYQVRKGDRTAQILAKEKIKRISNELKRVYKHRKR